MSRTHVHKKGSMQKKKNESCKSGSVAELRAGVAELQARIAKLQTQHDAAKAVGALWNYCTLLSACWLKLSNACVLTICIWR